MSHKALLSTCKVNFLNFKYGWKNLIDRFAAIHSRSKIVLCCSALLKVALCNPTMTVLFVFRLVTVKKAPSPLSLESVYRWQISDSDRNPSVTALVRDALILMKVVSASLFHLTCRRDDFGLVLFKNPGVE